MPDWESYLRLHSGLPGPRANLELAQAVAETGTITLFECLLRFDSRTAPANTPDEFLAFCGVLGIGRHLAAGAHDFLPHLRALAADPRWRIREAVAMALQMLGNVDMPRLLREMDAWSQGTRYEQRAVVAALCEPALLHSNKVTAQVLAIIDHITATLTAKRTDDKEAHRVLVKVLSYGWSVAVAADPEIGKARMTHWLEHPDSTIRSIMRANLIKKRLRTADPSWARMWLERLDETHRTETP